MKRSDCEPIIIAEWLKRPQEEHTKDDVLAFYGYLEKHCPAALSFKCRGSKYQTLKSILRHHFQK